MVGKIAVSLVSLLLVVGVVIGVVVVVKSNGGSPDEPPSSANSSMKMITSICELTTYKESCAGSLESTAKNTSATATDYLLAVVGAALTEVKKSLETTKKVVVDNSTDEYNHVAVEDCKEFLDDAVQTLQASISVVGDPDLHTVEDRAHELLSWMTAVYAYQTTCVDQIENPQYKSAIENGMVNATQLTHNAVNIVAEMSQVLQLFGIQQSVKANTTSGQRRLLTTDDGYPTWFSAADRRLLAGGGAVRPHAVVGSGGFKTIKQALDSYPAKHNGRYIIYVKAGVYDEQVIVDKNKPNIYMYGDGIGRTIVTGKKNFGKMKIGTMHTATFGNN